MPVVESEAFIVSLSDLLRIDARLDNTCVGSALSDFRCERDGAVIEDIVDFIRNKAIRYERTACVGRFSP